MLKVPWIESYDHNRNLLNRYVCFGHNSLSHPTRVLSWWGWWFYCI
jgi:hypothetical protein